MPIEAVDENRERLKEQIRRLVPAEGTPLYTVARDSYEQLKSGFEPDRINAVLLLTDGRNEDPRNDDVDSVLRVLRAGSEGLSSTQVRLFTIAYGRDADITTLQRLAQSTDAVAYDASDPNTITEVFTSVVSNF